MRILFESTFNMGSTRPYDDGMKKKENQTDFELLKKLSSKGIRIKPSLLKLCKRLAVFLSLVLIATLAHSQVELKNFTASFTGKKVKLYWGTITETNSNYYAVERSADGKTFQTIGMVKAADNSTSEINYSFFDKDYFEFTVYYRLKAVNNSGKEKPLAVIAAVQLMEDVKEIALFPPAYIPNRVYVDVSKINQSKVIIDVTDADGQKLSNKTLDKTLNETAVELKTAYCIQKGNYVMTAFYENHVMKSKLIIKDSSENFSEIKTSSKEKLFTLK